MIGTKFLWIAEDVEVLYKFRNVRRLTLYTRKDSDVDIDFSSEVRTEVLFPYLQTLRLHGKPPWEVVRVLSIPTLEEVEFNSESSFDLFKDTSFAPTIETIHIRILRSSPETTTSEKVEGLLAHVSRLRCLSVPQ
jgi:hypothetical protein